MRLVVTGGAGYVGSGCATVLLEQGHDVVIVDEAHLIPGASDTMYRRFIDTLARLNPQLKVIGFTGAGGGDMAGRCAICRSMLCWSIC